MKVRAITRINYKGKVYKPGCIVNCTKDAARQCLATGAGELMQGEKLTESGENDFNGYRGGS